MKSVITSLLALLNLNMIEPALAENNITFRSLRPDLSFEFKCDGENGNSKVRVFENFLERHNFSVLNKTSLAERLGEFSPYLLDIVGIDKSDRIIEFGRLKGDAAYAVVLRTRPPTVRDSDLEEKLFKFVENDIGCVTREVKRNESSLESTSLFDEVLRTHRIWFEKQNDQKI